MELNSDLFGLLSQLFTALLPSLPPNIVSAIEALTVVLGVIVSIWFANRDLVVKYLPNVIATTQYQFLDGVMVELQHRLGHRPKVSLSDPKAVADLILDDNASAKI